MMEIVFKDGKRMTDVQFRGSDDQFISIEAPAGEVLSEEMISDQLTEGLSDQLRMELSVKEMEVKDIDVDKVAWMLTDMRYTDGEFQTDGLEQALAWSLLSEGEYDIESYDKENLTKVFDDFQFNGFGVTEILEEVVDDIMTRRARVWVNRDSIEYMAGKDLRSL